MKLVIKPETPAREFPLPREPAVWTGPRRVRLSLALSLAALDLQDDFDEPGDAASESVVSCDRARVSPRELNSARYLKPQIQHDQRSDPNPKERAGQKTGKSSTVAYSLWAFLIDPLLHSSEEGAARCSRIWTSSTTSGWEVRVQPRLRRQDQVQASVVSTPEHLAAISKGTEAGRTWVQLP